jgi:RNA polymerase sigma factor (sigma-70 family)
MDDDDRELLERIRRGDGDGLAELYRRTRGWLLSFVILPRVGRDHAEDVLAETFRTAIARIGSFEWRGVAALHWLSAIARRKCQEHGRRTLRTAEREAPLDPLLDPPDPGPTSEAEMVRRAALSELEQRVAATLAEISPRYAEALRLRLLEGISRVACAERLGVSPATFDVILHRATRSFARAWRQS